MPRKSTERWQLERFLQTYGGTQTTEVHESEAPDFILVDGTATIGIEVTQLYRPAQSGDLSQRAVEAFRECVVRRAHRIYIEAGGAAVDVSVAFSDVYQCRVDLDPLAASLAETIRSIYPSAQPWILLTGEEQRAQLPAQFTSLIVSRHQTKGEGFWYMIQSGPRPLLDGPLLQSALDAKKSRVPAYRNVAEQIWLLIVTDALYLSSSFSVPDAVERERYAFASDRAFFFSALERRWWELLRQES